MAFNNLGLQEPSTITARVGTVTIARGSTTEHQEIMVLGDVSSSGAIARVLAATPASTEFGLAVRVVEQPSTTVSVSSIAGAVTVRSSAANALVTVYQSTAADLQATVAQASTVWQVQVGGYVAPSTTVNVSSLAGRVTVAPSDTSWASSAGFHFDSSGALQIVGTFSASTTVNVSSVAGVVTVSPQASSNSSVYLSVRITDGTAFLNYSGDYQDGSTYSSLTAAALSFNNSSNNTFRVAGLTTPFPMQVTDSSNTGVKPGDSANNAIRVNVVAGAAGGSTIVTISTVQGIVSVRPSDTNWASSAGFHFDSSGALQIVGTFSASTTVNVSSLAGIVAVRPSDTNWASSAGFHFNSSGELQVIGTFSASTTVNVSSLAGKVQVVNSSAADLNVTVAGYSTTVNVSSLAGAVIMRSSAANALVTVYQSTASALLMTATIGTNLQSTVAPSSGSSGLIVRQVIDVANVFASTSALASTTVEIQSSGANLRTYVTAYTITSTNQTPAHWGFFSSNGTLLWPLTLAALSSGVAGANLAVAAPGYLFRTAGASDALNFKTAGSTVSGVQLGVSFFRAP